ncbi:MAG: glycoside hydrolase family 2, partial [Bacteroidales bacterium]|nr:glycoside hydrolase family 2 [Bacteroidales bacterium]
MIFPIVLVFASCSDTRETLDLAGTWQFKLDANNEMVLKYPERCTSSGTIELPASLAEKGFGYKTAGSDFGVLTPEYKYIGKAWYSREIKVPTSWKNKDIEIFLERVLWESRLIIDGEELSRQDALGTPHVHKIGRLTPGKHTLTIVVDNNMIYNIGDKGHAYGAYTQSIWNGIVGRMEMRAFDPVRIVSVKTYPDIKNEALDIRVEISTEVKAKLSYEIRSLSSGNVVLDGIEERETIDLDEPISIRVLTDGKLKKWSEFTPEV